MCRTVRPAAGRTAAALSDIIGAAAASGLDFVRIEPAGNDALAALDMVHARAARPVQPRCTWLLDLTADEDSLRAGLESGHRSRINAAPRRGITVRSSVDPDAVVSSKRAFGGRVLQRAGT